MKRSPQLTPLSRDHHEALVLARRACEPERPGAEPVQLRLHLLERWAEHIEPQFRKEEEALLPALAAAGQADAVAEALAQHARLRGHMEALAKGDLDALPAWGAAMSEHVRWEERVLFPLAESCVDLEKVERAMGIEPTS